MSATKKAIIMIDLQNDFCAGGSLAVPDADAVIPLANQLQDQFDLIVASKDWHPHDHMSFAAQHPGYGVGDVVVINDAPQVLWPVHCVQDTKGAEFHSELAVDKIDKVVYKGTDVNIDSYSAFFDNAHLRATGLDDYLVDKQVEDIYLMGLATDYCVKFSALDAVHLGFNVYVIQDACRGVELNPGDITAAINEMQAAGVKIISMKDVV